MGYAMATSACIGCGRVFSYNPVRVPSMTVKGSREPICRGCVEIVNPRRIANGLAPIVPHPEAYEPCDEGELG
jgi:NAD-dependent SIR2 family protein deacetylase